MLLAPSLLAADFLDLRGQVGKISKYGDILHLDVMDGVFVPNISFGFPVLEAVCRETKVPADMHLMIVEPWKYLPRFLELRPGWLSFHLEAAEDAGEDPAVHLRTVRAAGVKAGLAIDPDVPVEKLFPYIPEADYVLVMSVFAGFGGQKFIPETFDRVRRVSDFIKSNSLSCKIEVDGGVGSDNASELAQAGCDIAVAGSAFFKAQDPAAFAEAVRGF